MNDKTNELYDELTAKVAGGTAETPVNPPKICPFCQKEVEFMVMSAGRDAEGNDRPHGIFVCPQCNKGINF